VAILDLGCGTKKEPHAIGVDVVALQDVDVVVNLEDLPYPFPDNTFSEIYLNDVIEHLPNTIKTMEELYRIARPDAHIYIRVINWNTTYQATDPTHVKAFSEQSFDFYGVRKHRSYYTHARFDVVSLKRVYDKRIQRWVFGNQRALNFLSRHLNNVLISLHFDLQAQKSSDEFIQDDVPLFDLLRCPHALKQNLSDEQAKLININDTWLMCQATGYRYPIHDDLPIFLGETVEQWRDVPIEDLPQKHDKPIERIVVQ
jgi:SAM-dependent methyltransferase